MAQTSENNACAVDLQSPLPLPEAGGREWYGLTGIERAHGITHPVLHEYMTITSTTGRSAGQLAHMGAEMARYAHPIMKVAAGWALAEAAMFRDKNRAQQETDGGAFRRPQNLDDAQVQWRRGIEGLGAAVERVAEVDPHLAGSFAGIQLRTHLALSALPIMKLITDCRSDKVPSQDNVADAVCASRQNLAAVGALIYQEWHQGHDEMRYARRGVAAEVIVYLALQKYQMEGKYPFVIIPASFRQDNNDDPRLRGDLVALDTHRYRKKLIQISREISREGTNRRGDPKVMMIKNQELFVAPKGGLRYTLESLLNEENDRPVNRKTTAGLRRIANSLGARVVGFAV